MAKGNLVLILCEPLGPWLVCLEIEGREVTPFFNSLVGDTSRVYYNRSLRSPFDSSYAGTTKTEASAALAAGTLWFDYPELR